MRILLLFLMLCCSASAEKGPWRAEFKRVEANDYVALSLNKWKAEVIEQYRKSGHSKPEFGSWQEIQSESLRNLFPDLRFITIHWNEVPAPDSTEKFASRAFGLFVILAVNPAGEVVHQFSGYGNYEEFGSLLSQQRIEIKSPDDATLVWNAFCDLHQKHWKEQGIKRVDQATWHLGIITIDRFHYYYRVDLDSQHRVIRGKLHADEIKPE